MLFACSQTAFTHASLQKPRLFTPMPEPKSMYSLPFSSTAVRSVPFSSTRSYLPYEPMTCSLNSLIVFISISLFVK